MSLLPIRRHLLFSRENSSIKRKERWSGLVLAAAWKELLLLLELPPTCRLLQDRRKGLRRGVGRILAPQITWAKDRGRELSGLGEAQMRQKERIHTHNQVDPCCIRFRGLELSARSLCSGVGL